jgi:hypothetical protein
MNALDLNKPLASAVSISDISVASPSLTNICCNCHKTLRVTEFSRRQLERGEDAKCKGCAFSSLSTPIFVPPRIKEEKTLDIDGDVKM